MSTSDYISHDSSQGFDASLQYDSPQQEPITEITKRHWVNNDDRPFCKSCKKKFSLIVRQHHCRRCGEVFCAECLQYRRRLTFLAKFDPQGKLYKVCKTCFEDGIDSDVTTRNLTGYFKTMKHAVKGRYTTDENANSSLIKTWRDKLNLDAECERLKKGFLESVNGSDVRRAIKELSLMVKTPDWQKSSSWLQENMAEKCQFCSVNFGLFTKKLACKLCGRAICKKCGCKDLLVYIPDEVVASGVKQFTEALVSVIRIVGSPEVEPEISILLHICLPCKYYVTNIQVAKVEKTMETNVKVTGSEFITKFLDLDSTIGPLQDKINTQLAMYQQVVESLEDGSRSSRSNNNTKTLAKTQDDLSDYFASLCIKIPVLKKLAAECETDTQRKLFNCYLRAKSDFYLENVHVFRKLKRKLSESAPPEMLEYIQKIVDKHAIVSAQIYIRQLTFESISLCVKHSLDSELIPKLLTHLDEIIEEDTNKCLVAQGESLEVHNQHLKEIVQSQMKDHKLVKTSKRQLSTNGPTHAAQLLITRLRDVLYQVMVQLDMKSINRSFQKTKAGLVEARREADKISTEDLLVKAL